MASRVTKLYYGLEEEYRGQKGWVGGCAAGIGASGEVYYELRWRVTLGDVCSMYLHFD